MHPDILTEDIGFFFSVDDVLSAAGCAVYWREINHAYRNPVKYCIKAMSSYKGMYFIPVTLKGGTKLFKLCPFGRKGRRLHIIFLLSMLKHLLLDQEASLIRQFSHQADSSSPPCPFHTVSYIIQRKISLPGRMPRF